MAKKSSKKSFLFIFIGLIIVVAGGTYLYFAEGRPPNLIVSPDKGTIGKKESVKIDISDKGSGLSSLLVEASQNSSHVVLLDKHFQKDLRSWQYSFSMSEIPFRDGPFTISVSVQDSSWNNFFQGNKKKTDLNYSLDTQPPVITPETFRHNLTQGGSGLVKYVISEPVDRTGLRVGQAYFPAYKQKDNSYLCFFSFPYNARPKKDDPVLIAVDRGGNKGQSRIHYHLRDRKFPKSNVKISPRFLQRKMPQFFNQFPQYNQAGIELFLKVNNDLRVKNRSKLKQIGVQTVPQILWQGKFLRQAGSTESGFGVRRSYIYQGENVDHQRHLGVDIASTARAPIKASNSGRIVYAGRFGIYGQAVVIDHGLGLQTLYGHLSQIGVKKGDQVKKGQIIGRSGATGLAGGDHLHFAFLVSGMPVNPVEWWDSHWIDNNIMNKLGEGF